MTAVHMNQRQKSEARAALDAALSVAFKAWGSGWWFSLERAYPALQASPFVTKALHHPSVRDTLTKEAAGCASALADLLGANKKEWAERRDEFALSALFRPNSAPAFGLVLMEKRRTIGAGIGISDPKLLPERFRQCNGIIMPAGIRNKEEIAWFLHEAGMLRSDVWIIEVPEDPGEDYRDVIAGSHWLRSDIRPKEDDVVGRALLTAMQARSFRKDAIKARRAGWWQALAAARMAKASGMPIADACARLGYGAPEIFKWAENAMTWKPRHEVAPANRPTPSLQQQTPAVQSFPATDKQKAVAASLLNEFPVLAGVFSDGWDKDRKSASNAIGKGLAAAERIRAAKEVYEREVSSALAEAGA